jgi:hypothetical protein
MRGAARGTRRSPAASQVKSQPDASRVDAMGMERMEGVDVHTVHAHRCIVHRKIAYIWSISGAGVCLSGAGVGAGVCSVGACALRCSPIHQNRHGVLLFLRAHAVFMVLRVETAGVGCARICRALLLSCLRDLGVDLAPPSSVPLAHLVVSFDVSSYVVSSFCDV